MSRRTEFEKMAAREVRCDICGGLMHPVYGGGWDNDRMICAAARACGCGAEIEFPTSTEVPDNAETTGRK